ncbi:hypothetical protein G6011_01553 [Alternaria panax]|uniref:NmrA-like domain-containing protein n=1 Tax=Alternaria panax TaxID=48097 RepID=A0AAD4NVN7_9PLEO|nr:hypothetical protein G6011_01553 [Alternaria panax]
MVKIAIAGGTGNVGQEIVDVLVASKKHEILIFTRKDVPTETTNSSVRWAKSTYEDVDELAGHLQGVDVVLSFIAPHDQQQGVSGQKNLIDAAVKAGVKRFAPSEWVSAGLDHMDWYTFKGYTRQYLAELNKDKKIIEYCLFQPGLFTNYFTLPYKSTKHVKALESQFDFEKRRAIVREGADDDYLTLTTVEDLANVVARAVDYKGEWPVMGGIRGSRIPIKEFIALGEELRGGPFTIERIPNEDLKNGTWTASWLPKVEHPSIPLEFVEAFSKKMVGGISLAIGDGAFDVGDEWNQLLPDYEFTDAKVFLRNAWNEATSSPTNLSQGLEPLISSYSGDSQNLVAAWPTAQDLHYICKLPIGLSTHLHIKLTSSSAEVMSQVPDNSREMLQLPPPGSHPVLLARKLLLLSSLLQGALSAGQIQEDQRGHFNQVMSRAMDTAVRSVTSNDELTPSVEGVECIMIEAMIQNYAGNLHRAWMTVHRASAVAQMLGLHRGSSKLSSFKILSPETRSGFDPDQLCCRIIEMDRYLSLTLGLPRSSLETRGFDAEAIAACHPLDRIARLQCIIVDRILPRRAEESSEKESENVRQIDEMLKEAAAVMPSQWWLAPDFDANDLTAPNPLPEIARTMYQLSHFHLVLRLHLPYVLGSSGNSMCEHSKATAIHAAREIMSRYIAFRKWHTGVYYCRGLDYLSFIALTVLCLVHIDARNQPMAQHEAVLDYSRPSDREMMERTVEILEDMKEDAIAMKLSHIMQYLLEVEVASANGIGYSTSTSGADDGLATECGGQFMGGENGELQLQIPHLGTVSLQRRLASSATTAVGILSTQAPEQIQPSLTEWDNEWSLLDSSNDMDALDDWTLQSINEGLFGGLFSGFGGADLGPELSLDESFTHNSPSL